MRVEVADDEAAAVIEDEQRAGLAPLEVYWRVFTEPPVAVSGLRPLSVAELGEQVARARAAGIAQVLVDANFSPELDSPAAWAALPARLAPLLAALILSVPALRSRAREQSDSLVGHLGQALARRGGADAGSLEIEVAAIRHAVREVRDDRSFDRPGIGLDAFAHGLSLVSVADAGQMSASSRSFDSTSAFDGSTWCEASGYTTTGMLVRPEISRATSAAFGSARRSMYS